MARIAATHCNGQATTFLVAASNAGGKVTHKCTSSGRAEWDRCRTQKALKTEKSSMSVAVFASCPPPAGFVAELMDNRFKLVTLIADGILSSH